ncbi:hypothetical protein DPMN_115791 [Dreissena polymorpha]|uniref:Uncharacterized protein n=1 Tax=Dreissena polymorpha TaxID=45954 RepID=A0A9D4QSY8_DREPO|nr:hypothetical protein DPMN_115791 [Dreissena polymorpha]
MVHPQYHVAKLQVLAGQGLRYQLLPSGLTRSTNVMQHHGLQCQPMRTCSQNPPELAGQRRRTSCS